MSTPTKRRKTNTYKPSPTTVGSLDFFFGKQKDGQGPKTRDHDCSSSAGDHTPTLGQLPDGIGSQTLTDEELARKLQYEWDEQDKVRRSRGDDPTTDAVEDTVHGGSTGDTAVTAISVQLKEAQDTDQFRQASKNSSYRRKDFLSLQSTASAENSISSTVPFDENPLTFDPSKYLPDLRKHWTELDDSASYAILTRCFILVNSTQSRIKIVDTLVNFLRTLIEGDPGSLLPAVCPSVSRDRAFLKSL